MPDRPLVILVLAAGKGTRMQSDVPKVLHKVAGRPMLAWVLEVAEGQRPAAVVVVAGPDMAEVERAAAPHTVAIQAEQLGTAHAVAAALPAASSKLGAGADLLVLYGDGPLITAETLASLRAARQARPVPSFVWLGFRPADPTGYGRILATPEGAVRSIVEEKDATAEERALDLCWTGLLLAEGRALARLLPRIDNRNAKGEYYLTSLARLAAAEGLGSAVVLAPREEEFLGVNSRAELARAEAAMQERLRARAMAGGASLLDPASVHLSFDTRLGRDVLVEPQVFFGPGVRIGDGVTIRAFSHLEGAEVEAGAVVGPFARLRPGASIGAAAHVGNFVEVKAARLGEGAKANHLTYLGDAEVGAGANIGAGTITCNYDGFLKHRTTIGAGAFIGSNSALVAPITVGAGAVVAAGSTLTEDVPEDALALARAQQENRPEAARRLRTRLAARKKKQTETKG